MALQEGAIGAEIVIQIMKPDGTPDDISAASTRKIYFRKPNRQTVEKTAEFKTNGTDGKLKYMTVANDLTPHGTWRCQGYAPHGTIQTRTLVGYFDVMKNL